MSTEKHVTKIRGGVDWLPTKVEVWCDTCGWRATRRSGAAAYKAGMAHEANPVPPGAPMTAGDWAGMALGCLLVLFFVGLLVFAIVDRLL